MLGRPAQQFFLRISRNRGQLIVYRNQDPIPGNGNTNRHGAENSGQVFLASLYRFFGSASAGRHIVRGLGDLNEFRIWLGLGIDDRRSFLFIPGKGMENSGGFIQNAFE
jgi:hypothetical protein